MHEISVIFIYQKLGQVGSIQQKLMLPSSYLSKNNKSTLKNAGLKGNFMYDIDFRM